jgi:hypothetical protein
MTMNSLRTMRGWDRYFMFGAAAGLLDSVLEKTIGTQRVDLMEAFLFKPASWALVWPLGVGYRVERLIARRKVYD